MRSIRTAQMALALVGSLAQTSGAQLAPPMIRASKPIGAGAGETVALEIRASDARDGVSLRFDDPRVRVEGFDPGKVEGNGLRTLKGRVTVPADAGPGPIGFRLVTGGGVSNPGRIRVGRAIPAVAEVELNDRLRKPQVISAPAAVEGAIANGDDVDVYAVELKAGETLVAEAIAARSGSRLDAWVTILSPDGRELASDDDLFGRDAAAWATAPASGRYLVAIQDANGKNRDGSIEQKMTRPYRLEIGRFPLIAAPFPAGARKGKGGPIRLLGANLPELARFDPPADGPTGDHVFAIRTPLGPSNAVTLRVGDAEEFAAPEPDDDYRTATSVTVPAAINGTFAPPDASGGDVDTFRLRTAPGSEGDYAISVLAARVDSPADPVLAVLDPKGEPRGEDDDKLGRDARIERRIDSRDGLLVSVRDYYGRGGDRFVYRIEVEPVAKGVAISADLGHRTVPRSGALAVPVAVERRGFEGPVTVLAGELPEGVLARPVTIPPGESRGLLVVSASAGATPGAFPLRLTARDVPVPASFAFRERGPIDEVPRENDQNKGPRETTDDATDPVLAVADLAPLGLATPSGPIVAPPGGLVEVRFTLVRRPGSEKKAVKVRLLAPGKALEGFEPVQDLDVKADTDSVAFVLKAKADAAPRSVTLAARAWPEGTPDLLGVDSAAVELVVPDRPRP